MPAKAKTNMVLFILLSPYGRSTLGVLCQARLMCNLKLHQLNNACASLNQHVRSRVANERKFFYATLPAAGRRANARGKKKKEFRAVFVKL